MDTSVLVNLFPFSIKASADKSTLQMLKIFTDVLGEQQGLRCVVVGWLRPEVRCVLLQGFYNICDSNIHNVSSNTKMLKGSFIIHPILWTFLMCTNMRANYKCTV